MRIDASRALGAYAAVTTLGCVWLLLVGAQPRADTARFDAIDAQRINIREPDGTLRLAISNHARIPGIVIGSKSYPHPNRPEAGMIFYDNQGVENGGLVFDGGMVDGKPTNGGSLTFDRYLQDQTVQLTSLEDGKERYAGLIVTDRPDGPIDFAQANAIYRMPSGPARDAAAARANFSGAQRAFLGRSRDDAAELTLRDGQGHARLRLRVNPDGVPVIQLLDATGAVTREIK